MEPGDEVTTTLGGRLVRGTVLYVRDGSVRIDVPGRKPITRPIARVRVRERVKALMPTVVQFANAAVLAGEMDADGYLEAMRTGTIPVDDYEAHKHLNAVFFPPSADEIEALKAKIAEHIEIDRAHRPVPKPPKPWRSEAYRAFIRGMDCCARDGAFTSCDGPIEAHHHGPHAMSQKGDDTTCIPLCAMCHRHFHDHGSFRGMTREDTDDIARVTQIECMGTWIRKSGDEPRAIIAKALAAHIREASK